jgi:hypothetical protein
VVYPNNSADEYAYGFDVELDSVQTQDGEATAKNITIRGGKGFNISYRFVVADLIESDATTVSDGSAKPFIKYNLELSSSKKNTSSIQLRCPETNTIVSISNINNSESRIRNYCDPFYVSNFLGY